MKISVNDVEIFTLNDTQKKVIQNNVLGSIFEEDMKRRLHWVIMHKYEECFKELKAEWDAKLEAAGIDMIPTKPDAYAELVFSQPEYKSRQQREDEADLARASKK